MENPKTKTLVLQGLQWMLRAFALGWAAWIFADYLFFTPRFGRILEWYPYWTFLILSLLAFMGLAFALKENAFKWEKDGGWRFSKIRGSYLLLAVLLFQLVFFQSYKSANTNVLGTETGSLFNVLIKLILVQGGALLVFLTCFAAGRRLVNYMSPDLSLSSKRLLSIAVGCGVMILAGLFLASMGIFNWILCWVLVVGILALNIKPVLRFLNSILVQPLPEFKLAWYYLPVAFSLLALISINALGIIRPVPFGFDALALYMNLPKLLHDYQSLVQGGQAYKWSIFMAYGLNLFDSTAITLYLSMLPGILAALVVFKISRLLMPVGKSLLAATVFYSSPLILWQSAYEAKVDLGLLFIVASLFLLLFEYFFKQKGLKKHVWEISLGNPVLRVIVLAGALMGIAFGIKYTALFFFVSACGMIVFSSSGALMWFGFSMVAIGLGLLLGLQRFSGIELLGGNTTTALICLSLGLLSIVTSAIVLKRDWKTSFGSLAILSLVLGLVFLPWPLKNVAEHGEITKEALFEGQSELGRLQWNQPDTIAYLSINRLELYANANPQQESAGDGFWRELNRLYKKNPFSDLNRKNYGKNISGKREEINRYMGYEPGAIRYLSLPYDNTMKTNVSALSTDIGPWLLALIPILFLFTLNLRSSLLSLLFAVGSLIFLSLSVYSVYFPILFPSEASEVDPLQWFGPSWYVAIFEPIWSLGRSFFFKMGVLLSGLYSWLSFLPLWKSILVCIGLFALLAAYWRLQDDKRHRRLQAMLSLLALYFMFWWLFASGIAWYGMFILCIAPIAILYAFHKKTDEGPGRKDPWLSGIIIGFMGLWLFFAVTTRLANNNTNGITQLHESNVSMTIPPLFAQYIMGMYPEGDILSKMNVQYPPALQYLNGDLSAKILRVGTYMNYFIERNDSRVYEDNQLEAFANLYEQTAGQKDQITSALNAQGIRYILFDLNTNQIDNTPDKSLTKKVKQMYSYLQNNPSVKLLVTDRVVKDPNGPDVYNVGGQQVRGSFTVYGSEVIQLGSFALFSIGGE